MYENNRHIDLMDLPVDEHEIPLETIKKPKEKTTDPETERFNRRVRVKELIDGTFLVRENMIRQLPFVLFLTFLGVIYIGNRFHAERMVRQINDLKIEVGNLRSEQITITSELMNISRPSEVADLVKEKNLGLYESMEPPKKLVRK